MCKFGRNQLCPCGSGYKYKKCCGAIDQQEHNAQTINQELYQVHEELISFTKDQYSSVIDKQLSQYAYDDALHDIYKIGLAPWLTMKLPLLENKKTIFQVYMEEKRNSLSLTTRHQLLQWTEREASVYKIIAVDQSKRGFARLQNIAGKKEKHIIPYDDVDNFPEGSLVYGIIIPFLNHDNFLFQMIRLFNNDSIHFKKLLLVHDNTPSLLKDVLENGLMHDQWLHPLHEEVADLFANYAAEKKYADKVIAESILLWNDYCKKTNPTIMKPEPHAAAFTYYFEKNLLNNPQVRQSEVAEQFNTSPSTLSVTYRRIAKELD